MHRLGSYKSSINCIYLGKGSSELGLVDEIIRIRSGVFQRGWSISFPVWGFGGYFQAKSLVAGSISTEVSTTNIG